MNKHLCLSLIVVLTALSEAHSFDEEFWINTTESEEYGMVFVRNLAASPCGKVFAATVSGLWQSADAGESWQHVPISNRGMMAGAHILRDGTIMIGGRDSLYYSTDCGEHWTTLTHMQHGIPQIDYHRFVEKSDGTLFVSMDRGYSGQWVPDGIWQSDDRGYSWNLVCDNFTNGAESMCIGLHPNGDVFWGSWDRGGIFVLRAESQSCHNILPPGTKGEQDWEPFSLGIDSRGRILLGTDQRRIATWTSVDTGRTWQSYDHRLTHSPKGDIETITRDRFDNFFVSALDTVWYTSDLAQSWTRIPGHLQPFEAITTLSLDSSDYLYVGTQHGRIYRSREPVYTTTSFNNSDVENLTTETLNLTLSPNPAAGELTINFLLANEELVAVRLYDMRGLLVKQLPEQRMTAGAQTVNLDVSNLGPGVYSLRLEAGGIVVNRLVIVHR